MTLEQQTLSNIRLKINGAIKENVSIEEYILMELHEAIQCIEEIIIDESKCHISKEIAIEEIKNILNDIEF